MPTAARGQTTATKRSTKKAAPIPPPKPPTGTLPLKQAKMQLVAFSASPFPYRSVVPDTDKPFLDTQNGRKRGHTTPTGDVYWEEPTYSDRRSLLYLPPGFDLERPALIVLFLHGQGATLERDVVARQGVPRQIAESGQNIALVAPQLALDASDSSAGNFWKYGHFAAYIDEAAERLMRLYGDQRAGRHFNLAPVVIVAYSGGYLSAAYALARGGADHRIKGVILLDALYGEEDKFATWAVERRRQSFLLSAYTESTRDENANLESLLESRRISYVKGLPSALNPGTFAFASCGGLDMHGDFVTRAWRPDPLKHALSMIPGYTVRGKQGA
jgi:pimeloyl-ACP methyl ester carboxylesterase